MGEPATWAERYLPASEVQECLETAIHYFRQAEGVNRTTARVQKQVGGFIEWLTAEERASTFRLAGDYIAYIIGNLRLDKPPTAAEGKEPTQEEEK